MNQPVAVPEVMSADLPAGVFLLDVREDDEWTAGHAPEAVHVRLGDLGGAGAGEAGGLGLAGAAERVEDEHGQQDAREVHGADDDAPERRGSASARSDGKSIRG